MSKPLWTILLVITAGFALWRGGIGVRSFFYYQKLGTEVPAQVSQVKVVPLKGKYALEAIYTYAYGGKNFTKNQFLGKPYYLNKSSAEREAIIRTEIEQRAWVNPKAPAFSSLENKFPLRELFYGICAVGIFLYFLYLKLHLELLERSS
ncbi:MAG: hypothetical protein KR126chlam1_01151 [Chlamydiae bacterium]|nr:hypothetical protein [Chlamydiota bacterium]